MAVIALTVVYFCVVSQKNKFIYRTNVLSRILLISGNESFKMILLDYLLIEWFHKRSNEMKYFFQLNNFYGSIYSVSLTLICYRSSREVFFILHETDIFARISFTAPFTFEAVFAIILHFYFTNLYLKSKSFYQPNTQNNSFKNSFRYL